MACCRFYSGSALPNVFSFAVRLNENFVQTGFRLNSCIPAAHEAYTYRLLGCTATSGQQRAWRIAS